MADIMLLAAGLAVMIAGVGGVITVGPPSYISLLTADREQIILHRSPTAREVRSISRWCAAGRSGG